MATTDQKNKIIFPFSEANKYSGESPPAQYIIKYLRKEFDPQTCVLECEYIDRDYLIDFSKYYSRSFDIDEKFTQRLHFFTNRMSETDFDNILTSNPTNEKILELNNQYLGFVVIKPITDARDNPIIGRTSLKTYKEKIDGDERVYLKYPQNVSLFGINLSVDSIPFQTQDRAVGACATIACWISLYPLMKLYGIPSLSPYEVTEKSISYPGLTRNFPSQGLNAYQMKNYYNAIGLDTELISIEIFGRGELYTKNDDVISDVVKAYLKLGVPVIAMISLKRKILRSGGLGDALLKLLNLKKDIFQNEYHAVVISGYRQRQNEVTELFIHDDGLGPYCKTTTNSDFSKWQNEWLTQFSEISVNMLMVPLYPKVRLPFIEIYQAYLKTKRYFEIQNEIMMKKMGIPVGISTELFLYEVKDYKKELLQKTIENKVELLTDSWPRFLLIIRAHFVGTPIVDAVYDATTINIKDYKKPKYVIKYKY
jgi:hypothetical protein